MKPASKPFLKTFFCTTTVRIAQITQNVSCKEQSVCILKRSFEGTTNYTDDLVDSNYLTFWICFLSKQAGVWKWICKSTFVYPTELFLHPLTISIFAGGFVFVGGIVNIFVFFFLLLGWTCCLVTCITRTLHTSWWCDTVSRSTDSILSMSI